MRQSGNRLENSATRNTIPEGGKIMEQPYELTNENLIRYKHEGLANIDGWCSENLIDVIDLLCKADINQKGGCLEIGVHHGKFFILLNQVISADQSSFALDLFDHQSLNVDRSGEGSLKSFKSNLKKYDAHGGSNVTIISGDSTDAGLNLETSVGLGSMRFISIDGGHTAEHTINDLQIGNRLISNEGVVILDDITHLHWLGVIEGVCRFLDTKPTLVPFAIGLNKLFLCKLSFQNYYFNLFSTSSLKRKDVSFYGFDIVSLQ